MKKRAHQNSSAGMVCRKGAIQFFSLAAHFPEPELIEHLLCLNLFSKKIPSVGIVLDCCTKPSHDLGRDDFFNAMFERNERFSDSE